MNDGIREKQGFERRVGPMCRRSLPQKVHAGTERRNGLTWTRRIARDWRWDAQSPSAPVDSGAICGTCGFRYESHRGHIIACPVCRAMQLERALKFYADGQHFDKSGAPDAWDTVSGEPPNYWCDEAGTATVEDGSIAKLALTDPEKFARAMKDEDDHDPDVDSTLSGWDDPSTRL